MPSSRTKDGRSDIKRVAEESPFSKRSVESEGWCQDAFDRDYCAFDPDLLSSNDSLFNELLLAAHALKLRVVELDQQPDDASVDAGTCSDDNPAEYLADLGTFVEMSADAFGLDRPCLVCRVLDEYRREYGLSAEWMADYAFLCAKCLASPPCATVTFVCSFEFVYVMDKHFLQDRGATLVSAFGRKVLTFEDVQRHFFLHGCFRTDGGVPGRRQDEIVIARPRPGRPIGGRAGPSSLGSAKVLYSNYSFLAQTATKAMMCTLTDYGSRTPTCGQTANASLDHSSKGLAKQSAQVEKHCASDFDKHRSTQSYTCCGYDSFSDSSTTSNKKQTKTRYAASLLAPSGTAQQSSQTQPQPVTRGCPTSLAVALAGWKECAKGVECSPTIGRRGDSCVARAMRDDDDYEMGLERDEEQAAATESYATLFPNCKAGRDAAESVSKCKRDGFERTRGYGDLALLLLAGTGSVPSGGLAGGRADEFITLAARIRKETVESYWEAARTELGQGAVVRFSRFYEEDAEPDLDLGPIMLTHLKHAQTRGGTSAECLPCNLMMVKEYWVALRRLRRDIIAYSSNNVGLFHSVEPVLNEWDDNNKLGHDDGRCFINLMKGAGPEAVYKHMFCDPMCAARVYQTNPRVLFEHPSQSDPEELILYKARLASANKFEGRVCAGLWALAYTCKAYQVFPPRPTSLAAFVKDAGSMLHRHSLSLISLEHTLDAYV